MTRDSLKFPDEFLYCLPDSEVRLLSWIDDVITLSIVKDATPEVWQVQFLNVECAALLPAFTTDMWKRCSLAELGEPYARSVFSGNVRAFVLHNVDDIPQFIIAEEAIFKGLEQTAS
jgi:hypothetical protein